MASNHQPIMAKARGFTISISKMNDRERARYPSEQYGRDYNRLVEEAQRELPELVHLLPPSVEMAQSASGIRITDARYSEIDSYCEQIYQLVSTVEEL